MVVGPWLLAQFPAATRSSFSIGHAIQSQVEAIDDASFSFIDLSVLGGGRTE